MKPKITRALISVSDKSGLKEFARALHDMGVEILSTGGTARAIAGWGIPVVEVADYTRFPECFDGRVKTLHPKIHGGFLYQRENPEHVEQAQKLEVPPIDLVVVNLYPFEKTITKEGVTLEEAIENIDIGGPAMLRGAAKNYVSVTVVVDPEDYGVILTQMVESDGATTLQTRKNLALKVFDHTAQYDKAIGTFLFKQGFAE